MATAASAAFPPDSSIFAPIADAVGSFDAHMPFLLRTGDLRLFQHSIICKLCLVWQDIAKVVQRDIILPGFKSKSNGHFIAKTFHVTRYYQQKSSARWKPDLIHHLKKYDLVMVVIH